MSYLYDSTKDRVLSYAKIHWIIYLRDIILLLVGISICFTETWLLAPLLFLLAIILFIKDFIYVRTTELAITSNAVIVKTGFIRRETIELRLDKLESIRVVQSILGRILDYGSIYATGSGITTAPINRIQHPLRFKKQVEDILQEKSL